VDRPIYTTFQAEIGAGYPLKDEAEQLQEAAARLTDLAATCRDDALGVTTSLIEGSAGLGIMEEARRARPMMIVLGSHGHGALHHLLTGSVCEYVMKHVVRHVVIVPSRAGTYATETEPAEHAATV